MKGIRTVMAKNSVVGPRNNREFPKFARLLFRCVIYFTPFLKLKQVGEISYYSPTLVVL